MATFNTIPGMSNGGNPPDNMAMNHGAGHQLGIDPFESELAFDESMLDGAALHGLPFTTSYDLDAFAPTFEDPFSYSTRHFEPPPAKDASHEDASPQELDNKLLGFSDTIMHATLHDEMGKFVEMHMSAELYGMFFVAEDVFGAESTGRPLELTCYRRNLWQCSGQITLPRITKTVIDEQGQNHAICDYVASITAVESIEGKTTEIISIPWKSSAAQAADEPKVAGAPPNITLDLNAGQEAGVNRVSVPVSWKRLQFKHATANNGRRKGLQQHYLVNISLFGRDENGSLFKIAEIRSGPVIVRGRSPRNFDSSKKDSSVASEKKTDRKSTASSETTSLKVERETLQPAMHNYQSMSGNQPSNDWATPQPFSQLLQSPHSSNKRVALSPTMTKPLIPPFSNGPTSTMKPTSAPPAQRHSTSIPINLSLSEDERSPNRSSADGQSPNVGKVLAITGYHAANSPPEEDDLLYEYFPLSLDDWLPPVDAVYRPHVVHHTVVPPEMKAQQTRNKAKRYFTD